MDIAIKWPNDIYYHRDKKVGGIICQSFHNGRAFEVTIGVGINISNKKPTTCMDEIEFCKMADNKYRLIPRVDDSYVMPVDLNRFDIICI